MLNYVMKYSPWCKHIIPICAYRGEIFSLEYGEEMSIMFNFLT